MFGLVCVSDVHTLNLPVVQPWFREQEFPTPAEVLRVCSQACLMVSTASEDKPEQQLLLCFAVAITMLGSSKKMGKLDIVNSSGRGHGSGERLGLALPFYSFSVYFCHFKVAALVQFE